MRLTPRRRCLAALVAMTLLPLVSCISLPSVTAEERTVESTLDPSKTIEFVEPVVWLDRPGRFATRGVRLPVGRYELEAENEEYLYFRAPAPIEVRVLQNGSPVDGRDIPGGLALAKSLFNLVPAATYIDATPQTKMHIMKHDQVFMSLEGRQWKKHF